MASVDVLRDLWKRLDTPSGCPDVSLGHVLETMCDILAKEGYGGGNSPFECWILAYLSLTGGAATWDVQLARQSTIFVLGCTFEEEEDRCLASNREVERELENLRFRGFLVRDDEGMYRIKP